ncbi:ABC transporter substrate-binding protein [Paenibacillus sp. NRS-1782]|uniref:ABC transporter substrate-binding protein n=1 Tax=unclassified Paenibacillus TaxID=185978 RepID=UPI003D28FE0D
MKRKIGSAFLSLVIASAVGLAGCSDTSSKSEGANESNAVTLQVWGDQVNQPVTEQGFKKINEIFMKNNPGIQIDFQYTGTLETIDTAVKANSLPDVFYVQGNKTPKMDLYVKSGALLPLNDYKLDTSRYPKEAVEYGTVDGKLYTSPPSFMDSQLMYYNKDIFSKYNLEAPKTFDEFVKVAETLKSKGITPVAMPGKDAWSRLWIAFSLLPALGNDALQAVNHGKGDFSDPGIIKAFQTIRDFADRGYFSNNLGSVDAAGAQLAFTNGKAAMIADGTWNNSTYESSMSNLGRFYIPGTDGKKTAPQSLSNLMTYAASANTKHPKEAAEYIKYLASQEAQQIFATETGAVPIIDDIKPKDEGVKEMAAYDGLGDNIYTVLTNVSTDEVKLTDIFLEEVMPKLLTSKITGQEAVEILNAALAKTK